MKAPCIVALHPQMVSDSVDDNGMCDNAVDDNGMCDNAVDMNDAGIVWNRL